MKKLVLSFFAALGVFFLAAETFVWTGAELVLTRNKGHAFLLR